MYISDNNNNNNNNNNNHNVSTAVEESFINRWNRPVDPDMLIAIVRIQSLYRGYRIRNAIRLSQTKYIIETLLSVVNFQHHSNNDSNNNSVIEKCEFKLNRFIQKRILQRMKRLSTGWMSCLNLLQQGQRQSEAGNKLIERLVVTNSRTSDNNNNSDNSNFSIQSKFYKDIDSYLSIKEYSGTCSEIPSPCPMHNTGSQLIDNDKCNNNPFHKDWIHLLFRDCIYPSKLLKNECVNHEEGVKYSIRLKTTISDSYILLVNNDNGKCMKFYTYSTVVNRTSRFSPRSSKEKSPPSTSSLDEDEVNDVQQKLNNLQSLFIQTKNQIDLSTIDQNDYENINKVDQRLQSNNQSDEMNQSKADEMNAEEHKENIDEHDSFVNLPNYATFSVKKSHQYAVENWLFSNFNHI
ncbi:unnamed protein product [Schistosoma turkestanicum]|nr:unnamed protein product [Schistosoma turkestanicum]